MSTTLRLALACAALAALAGSCATATPPAESYDGLVRDTSVTHAELYKRPGASIAGYREYGLVPCQVAFRKNWQRDHNRDALDLGSRIDQQDVDRIKDRLGEECDRYFREALQAPPAYTLVEQFENGEQVLVIRPNIVNLDINAPDTLSSGRSRSYTTSAGEMTLVLELLDATTGEILVRAVDRKRAPDYGRLQWTDSVTNRAEAQRMLRGWATRLRQALDSARGGS